MATTDIEVVCPKCGKQYGAGTNGPSFLAKHVAKCKGKVQTRGRIDRLTRRPKAARSPTSSEVAKQEPRPSDPPRSRKARSSVQPERYADVIEALRAQRDKIDEAIRAVEALA